MSRCSMTSIMNFEDIAKGLPNGTRVVLSLVTLHFEARSIVNLCNTHRALP